MDTFNALCLSASAHYASISMHTEDTIKLNLYAHDCWWSGRDYQRHFNYARQFKGIFGENWWNELLLLFYYWNCNFPMSPQVRLLVDWPVVWSVYWSFCHNFPKGREGSYTYFHALFGAFVDYETHYNTCAFIFLIAQIIAEQKVTLT